MPCCKAVYLLKRVYAADPSSVYGTMLPWIGWFLVPATMLLMIFFLMTAAVQFRAFAKGHTPYPNWCCVFSLFAGFVWLIIMRLCGDHALTNALGTGWISAANLWMMGGLLYMNGKVM